MRIDSSGNVGIGTSSPLATIHTRTTTGGVVFLEDSDATSTFNITELSNNAGNFGIQTRDSSGVFVSTDYQIVKNASGADYQRWFTQGAERMRIDAAGNVGIGTSSPIAKLETSVSRTSGTNVNAIVLSDNVTGTQTSGFGTRIEGRSNNGTARSAIGFEAFGGTNNDTGLGFYTQATAGNLTRQMTITSIGRVGIGTNSPSQALDVVGNIEVSGGVYLGGTVAANLLDDYEEGTFTPVLTGSTSGTLNGTGVYTKVGNKVTIFITFTVTTGTKPTGDYSITGLPFTSKTTSPDATSFTVAAVRVTFDSAKRVVAAVAQNSSVISMAEETSNALGSAITDANFVNGSNMFFRLNGTYLVD